ncbi:hypothetical protein ACHAXT_007652 [Thalassiosira profunda]
MVRRLVSCRECRARFATKSGSKLCLSCRSNNNEEGPVSTSGGHEGLPSLPLDGREGGSVRSAASNDESVEVISIGSDSDDEERGGVTAAAIDGKSAAIEEEHCAGAGASGKLGADGSAHSERRGGVLIDLSEMEGGGAEGDTESLHVDGGSRQSVESSSAASSGIPSPWKAADDVCGGMQNLAVARPAGAEADAVVEGNKTDSTMNDGHGQIAAIHLSDEGSVSSLEPFQWDEDQPAAVQPPNKGTRPVRDAVAEPNVAPEVAAIDISDDSDSGDDGPLDDDDDDADSSVSSDDSIWGKKGFESKPKRKEKADDGPRNEPASREAPPATAKPAPKGRDDTANKHFHCYLLRSLDPKHPLKTYIGFTTHPQRRIRQHNGLLKSGGARRTKRSGRPWTFVCVVHGFEDKIAALQFEWAWQNVDKSKSFREAVGDDALARKLKRRHGPKARLDELRTLLKDALPFSLYSLTVYFPEREYHSIFSGMLRRGRNGNPYVRDEGEGDAHDCLLDIQICALEKMPAAREEAALKERKKREREAKKLKKQQQKKAAGAVNTSQLRENVVSTVEEENWFDLVDDEDESKCSSLESVGISLDGSSRGGGGNPLDGFSNNLADERAERDTDLDCLGEEFLGLSIGASPTTHGEESTKPAAARSKCSTALSLDSSIVEVGNQSSDDGSVSPFGSTNLDRELSLATPTKESAPVEGADRLNDVASRSSNDSSSVSSDESIWNKKGFEAKRKEGRIESYYDYHRFQNRAKSAPVVPSVENADDEAKPAPESLPPEVPLPTNATWRLVLLMDHREFGCANNFLQMVEQKMNDHFGGKCAEITTLASADYLYVARLISDDTGEILDERVMDLVIERKAVQDACQCLIADSKKYKPLSFFEAQMYKMQHSGVSKKIFLMEGDEHKTKNFFSGCKGQREKDIRMKRVKTLRLQLANGEFKGVELVCTKNRWDSIKWLIQQLNSFQQSFDPRRPPTKTREQLKHHINEQMKAPTFLEYLRLRSIPGIGDAKAMKVIMDPTLDWDKSFLSPSSSKTSKATLQDRAAFWKPPSGTAFIFAKSSKTSGKQIQSTSQAKPRSKWAPTKTKDTSKATELRSWLDVGKENNGGATVIN